MSKNATRFTDWADETVEIVEEGPPPPHAPPPSAGATVVYSEEEVVAYFDSQGRSVPPTFATHAQVWTPDGKVRIISFEEEESEQGAAE